ncbi:MAG: CHC2 zinc finger domain-containing protein [Clostridiales bacterium]|nr:CHC2 zinc finger domain-containing protein [Clostridiales bacterium]
MNVFEAVRDTVTARQAAETYGIKIGRSGKAVCPFHNDRNPSLQFYEKRYHCFGCQADGDAIDFTAQFFGLSKKDAAIKLAEDFSIPYEDGRMREGKKQKEKKPTPPRRKSREELLEKTERDFFRIISYYNHILKQWKTEYAPQPEDGEWHPLFTEALSNITVVEYLMDTLLTGDTEEKIDLMNGYREKVMQFEERVKGSAATEAGGAGQNDSHV